MAKDTVDGAGLKKNKIHTEPYIKGQIQTIVEPYAYCSANHGKDTEHFHVTGLPGNKLASSVCLPNRTSRIVIYDYIPTYSLDIQDPSAHSKKGKLLSALSLPNFIQPCLYGLPSGQLIISETANNQKNTRVIDIETATAFAKLNIHFTPYKMPIIFQNMYLAGIGEDGKSVLIYPLKDFAHCITLVLEETVIALISKPKINGLVLVFKNGAIKTYGLIDNRFEPIDPVSKWDIIAEYESLFDEPFVAHCSSFSSTNQITYCPTEQENSSSKTIQIHHNQQCIRIDAFKSNAAILHLEDLPQITYTISQGITYGAFLDDDFFALTGPQLGPFASVSLAAQKRLQKVKYYLTLEMDSISELTFHKRGIERCKNDVSAQPNLSAKPLVKQTKTSESPHTLFPPPKEKAKEPKKERSCRSCWSWSW